MAILVRCARPTRAALQPALCTPGGRARCVSSAREDLRAVSSVAESFFKKLVAELLPLIIGGGLNSAPGPVPSRCAALPCSLALCRTAQSTVGGRTGVGHTTDET